MKASKGCATDETRQKKNKQKKQQKTKNRITTADAVEHVVALKIWYNSAT